MDNRGISRILREIADLLEIKNENPFKIRAYRNGADIAANHPHHLESLDEAGLREIPGIGKDLAARIREIAETGASSFHKELVSEFAPTILDLLRLQGVGPKTVATLYRELGIRTLDDLERAAADGRVRSLRGMGTKKEALIVKALEERRRFEGRHLLPASSDTAAAVVAYLKTRIPDAQIEPVGSLRRGCETCGDLDLLASGAPLEIMDAFVHYDAVERVLGQGATKSSVLLSGGFQADLRLVSADSRGAALQYFTGSKPHNIALRDRAMGLGLKLNEYGLFRISDDSKVAGLTEEEIYEGLGLEWIPPELREMRGEIAAAANRSLPRLVERADLRGDLHMHTTESDGKDDLRTMALAARAQGHEYIAITEHSQSLAMANGLDERRAAAHAARIRALDAEGHGIRILAGIECDIKADGSLDLSDDCLASLDVVVASIHSAFTQDRRQMTERVLKAIDNPHVDILGHPTGRAILRREPIDVDMATVVDAAREHGVAMEINCQAHRLDLNDVNARLARDRGVSLVISTDAHSHRALESLRFGVLVARRAWAGPQDVLNTRSFEEFRNLLRRNARRARVAAKKKR
ncbi:MAG TPA: DNA polymerase/3'-5' exonuclease PolX [Vicinamibacterales bacterium]